MTDLHPFGVNNMAGNCRWQNDGNVVGGGGGDGENKYDEERVSERERRQLRYSDDILIPLVEKDASYSSNSTFGQTSVCPPM